MALFFTKKNHVMTSRRHVSTGEVNNVVQTKLGSRLQCDENWVKIAF